jgi:hypothetical protein
MNQQLIQLREPNPTETIIRIWQWDNSKDLLQSENYKVSVAADLSPK